VAQDLEITRPELVAGLLVSGGHVPGVLTDPGEVDADLVQDTLFDDVPDRLGLRERSVPNPRHRHIRRAALDPPEDSGEWTVAT
jgi:hypothetical protein